MNSSFELSAICDADARRTTPTPDSYGTAPSGCPVVASLLEGCAGGSVAIAIRVAWNRLRVPGAGFHVHVPARPAESRGTRRISVLPGRGMNLKPSESTTGSESTGTAMHSGEAQAGTSRSAVRRSATPSRNEAVYAPPGKQSTHTVTVTVMKLSSSNGHGRTIHD